MINRYESFSISVSSIYKYIQKIEREVMISLGLKGPHAQIITILSRYPNGITSAELSRLCEKNKAAISRSVAELEEIGLIMRCNQSGNAYKALIMLTDKGKCASKSISSHASKAVELVGSGISDEDREALYRSLEIIYSNIEKLSTEGLETNEPD